MKKDKSIYLIPILIVLFLSINIINYKVSESFHKKLEEINRHSQLDIEVKIYRESHGVTYFNGEYYLNSGAFTNSLKDINYFLRECKPKKIYKKELSDTLIVTCRDNNKVINLIFR